MIQIIQKNWKTLSIVIGVALVIFLIYYFGKSKSTIKPTPLPHETSWGQSGGISESTGITAAESQEIRNFTYALYQDLESTSLLGHDIDIYSDLNKKEDAFLIAVYNDFNDIHFSKGKGTLKQWILDDYFSPFTVDIVSALVSRFDTLNLA